MIRRPPRSTLFPYTDALPILPGAEVRRRLPGGDRRRGRGGVRRRRRRERRGGAPAHLLGAGVDGPLARPDAERGGGRSEEHTSELQSRQYLGCRLLLEKKNQT